MAHSPDLFFSYVLERGNLGFLLLGLTRLGKPLFKKKDDICHLREGS